MPSGDFRAAPCIVVFSGLPGTGKSTLAVEAARLTGAPVFVKDELEATLRRSGIGRDQGSGFAAVELLFTLAETQLRIGQSAIFDTVAPNERIRGRWREIAARYGGEVRVIECVCSDEATHRRRLAGRVRNIPGWYEVTWEQVETIKVTFEPWNDDRLVLDAMDPLDENLRRLAEHLTPSDL